MDGPRAALGPLRPEPEPDRQNVTGKTTRMHKALSEQEELVVALDQRLRAVLRPEETEVAETDACQATSYQSPLCDELDILNRRIEKHNYLIRWMLERMEIG